MTDENGNNVMRHFMPGQHLSADSINPVQGRFRRFNDTGDSQP